MSDATKIEWTDATWNPITGCSVHSAGCTNCYAMQLAGTRLKNHPSRAGLTKQVNGNHVWTGKVRFNEDWLDQPLRWKRPRRIFVCAHGDLFHENVPDEWIDRVFAVMALAPQHTFQVLTKRSERMREYFAETWQPAPAHTIELSKMGDFDDIEVPAEARGENRWDQIDRAIDDISLNEPLFEKDRYWTRQGELIRAPATVQGGLPNVWLGVSVEDQATADARIPDLLATLAARRFISAEPLLGPVKLPFDPGTAWCPQCQEIVPDRIGQPHENIHQTSIGDEYDPALHCATVESMINWVIVGGESGPDARDNDFLANARSLRDQCATAGVPFFAKQNVRKAPLPDDLLIREFPDA